MLKRIANRIKAKKEHKNRMSELHWLLPFNIELDTRKVINKQVLFNELLEATNANPNDPIALLSIERSIEDAKLMGFVTEFYTKSEIYNK